MNSEITVGSVLGPYRIEGIIGAGGMGQVFRASDTRLGRAVAIKTSDERFTERFEREARAIAALNHPNICTLYDVGPDYLVMELIEGESLAERLVTGPIPLDEALAIAAQLAAALDVAHESGIVHRDLKPANVRITPSGMVKVLDFGIARMLRSGTSTIVASKLTQTGAVVGTTGYMAPEQLRGEPVDKRADIWAFGVVLYEMITGERPRGSASDERALEAVLASGSGWERMPENVQRALKSCLAGEPRDRLRDIGDWQLLLAEASVADSAPSGPSRRAFVGAVAGGLGAAALGAWGWLRAPAARAPERVRFTALLPPGARVSRAAVCAPSLALLPDGRTLIIAVTDGTGRRLYRRGVDELAATPIEGTAGAMSPFCSPDGRWIGFYADARLRRVPAEGGVSLDIAPAPGAPTGASWGPGDRIVFTHGWRSPLRAVSASGGPVETIAPLRAEDNEIYMRSPQFLPGGRYVLLELALGPLSVYAIDLESGARARLTAGATPRFANGNLVFTQGATVFASPLDTANMTLTGPPTQLVEGVAVEAGGARHYAISPSGTLAHAPGTSRHALALTDLAGSGERILDEGPRFNRPRFAPDGRRLSVAVAGESFGDDVWLYDVVGPGVGTRLTFDGGTAPIWSPDGATVAFSGDPFWTRRQPAGLYSKSADGRTTEQHLLSMSEFHRPIAWTSDQVLFELTTAAGELRIERFAGGERQPLMPGFNARLSSDGRLLAYVSDESGRETVYVSVIGEGSARWQIAEGSDPAWGADGSELYYVSGTQLKVARLDTSAGVRVLSQSTVQESFAVPVYGDYDVSPDGRSIAIVRPVDLVRGREVTVALDWLGRSSGTPLA